MPDSGTQIFPGSIGHRPYLSTHYLTGANHFIELAKRIEENWEGRKRFDPNHRAFVIGAIVLIVNFLEAAVNELYLDSVDEHLTYIASLSPSDICELKCHWKMTEGQNVHLQILGKYQKALDLLKQPKFDTDRAPYQDVGEVISFRDSLVHFKPKTYSIPDQDKLLSGLRSRIGTKRNGIIRYPLNSLAPGDKGTMALDRVLGFGTATWARDSAKAFADEFFLKIGITPNYQRVVFHPPSE
jgi:hypothetical protein